MKIPPLKPSPYVENNSSNCKENATNISLSNNNKENSRLNTTPQDKLGIPRRYNSSPLRRSVLRPGETIESLFRVDPHESSPDYRSLCQDLVHHHADQPSMWRQVLKQATERANQDESKGMYACICIVRSGSQLGAL